MDRSCAGLAPLLELPGPFARPIALAPLCPLIMLLSPTARVEHKVVASDGAATKHELEYYMVLIPAAVASFLDRGFMQTPEPHDSGRQRSRSLLTRQL